MKFVKSIIISTSIFLACCDNNQLAQNQFSYKIKIFDYGTFTIEVPENWVNEGVGVEDSYVGNIKTEKNSFISFDLGAYSNDLNEDDNDDYYQITDGKVFIPDKNSTQKNKIWVYFGKADPNTVEKVRRNNIEWETIDNFKSKIVTPKKIGNGLTGVYIDSLWTEGPGKIKFQMSGYNLKLEQQRQLLNAIRSLRFHQNIPMKFVLKN